MDITILILTYNRPQFSKIISHNINIQDYGNIKEVIVLDDGSQQLDLSINYPIKYIQKKNKMTIGMKRNMLIKECKTKLFCFMDDDDIYFPTYISHSIDVLTSNKKYFIVGSTDMLFYFKNLNGFGFMSCSKISLPHEATFVGYTKYMKSMKFKNNSAGEGAIFKDNTSNLGLTDIDKCMMCIVHDNNTIPKMKWYKEEQNKHYETLYRTKIQKHLDLL